MADAATETSCLAVTVTDDRMQAHVVLASDADIGEVNLQQVVKAAEQVDVVVTDSVTERIEQWVRLVAGGDAPDEPYLISEGRPAVEGEDGRLEWAQGLIPFEELRVA